MISYFTNASRRKKQIALTFDDGPNPYITQDVLNILDKYNIKASFFILGKYAKKYPHLVRDIIAKGHLIGNHTYSHIPPIKTEDFRATDKVFQNILGFVPQYIRFPFGIRNNLYFADNWEMNYLKDKIIVDFDVSSKDWKWTSSKIINQVISNVKEGSIIDFHDGSENEKKLQLRPRMMLKALPHIIEKLFDLNFVFKRVDELDFKGVGLTVITSVLKWDNQLHRLIYTDSENFNKIPVAKIKQVYGICFYGKKLVIGWNQKTQMWNFQGGSVKKGELWLHALKRELQEESNMKMISFVPLGYQISINPENEVIYQLRLACQVKPRGRFLRDPDGTVIKIKIINPRDYKKYIDWGRLGSHLISKSLKLLFK